ncbi:hypothetical protein EV122DRAFT_281676 [Schizophyllum commune]
MAVIKASYLGKRPGWLIGQSSLGVILTIYEDHVVHDLLANLPPEVAELYDSKLRSDTKEALSFYVINTRYSMTTKCKKAMRQIFGYLDLPDGIFVPSLEPRRQSSKVAVLLGRGPNSTAISQQPPLIYGTLEGESLDIPFASKAIENVLQVIMYGGNSFNNADGVWPKNASAYKWGLSSVTPGTIAFSAIMAIYLLSGDKELSNTGDYSRFDYRSCFMVFAGSLWTSWTCGATARLVAHLNKKFFANLPNYPDATSTPLSAAAAGSSTIERSRNLLADLQDSDAPLDPEPIESAAFASPAQSPPPSPISGDFMTPADAHELPLPPLIAQEADASSAPTLCGATDSCEVAGIANVLEAKEAADAEGAKNTSGQAIRDPHEDSVAAAQVEDLGEGPSRHGAGGDYEAGDSGSREPKDHATTVFEPFQAMDAREGSGDQPARILPPSADPRLLLPEHVPRPANPLSFPDSFDYAAADLGAAEGVPHTPSGQPLCENPIEVTPSDVPIQDHDKRGDSAEHDARSDREKLLAIVDDVERRPAIAEDVRRRLARVDTGGFTGAAESVPAEESVRDGLEAAAAEGTVGDKQAAAVKPEIAQMERREGKRREQRTLNENVRHGDEEVGGKDSLHIQEGVAQADGGATNAAEATDIVESSDAAASTNATPAPASEAERGDIDLSVHSSAPEGGPPVGQQPGLSSLLGSAIGGAVGSIHTSATNASLGVTAAGLVMDDAPAGGISAAGAGEGGGDDDTDGRGRARDAPDDAPTENTKLSHVEEGYGGNDRSCEDGGRMGTRAMVEFSTQSLPSSAIGEARSSVDEAPSAPSEESLQGRVQVAAVVGESSSQQRTSYDTTRASGDES